MDEPREIKIITPAMSVESTWLEDVFSAKIPVLVFRGFLSRRRQKLSATPDLSGTVLPYVLFRTQR